MRRRQIKELYFRRLKIEEESIGNVEGKVEAIKSQKIAVEASGAEGRKQRVNGDICYCDRAPCTSRDIASPKPHVKSSYCAKTESGKAAATAANKSDGKTTTRRVAASDDDKLSPVAKNFGSRNKTSKSLVDTVIGSNDTTATARESFSESRDIKDSLKKSIFSCVSSSYKERSVIIEELPNDEVREKYRGVIDDSNGTKVEERTSFRDEKSTVIEKSCIRKSEKLISEKKSPTKKCLMPNKIRIADKYQKGSGKLETGGDSQV